MTRNWYCSINRNLRLGDKERDSNSWMIEEEHLYFKIVFNGAGTVVKKTKIIIKRLSSRQASSVRR